MAYSVPIGGILEVVVFATQFNERVMNTYHWRTGVANLTDGEAAAGTFVSGMVSADLMVDYANAVASTVDDMQISAQWIYPTRRPKIVYPTTYAGAVEEPALPSNVSMVFSRSSEVAVRGGTGSVHLFGVPRTFVEANVLTTAGTTALAEVSQWGEYAATITGGTTMTPIILKRLDPGLSTPVSAITPRDSIRTMRRRGVRLGE